MNKSGFEGENKQPIALRKKTGKPALARSLFSAFPAKDKFGLVTGWDISVKVGKNMSMGLCCLQSHFCVRKNWSFPAKES